MIKQKKMIKKTNNLIFLFIFSVAFVSLTTAQSYISYNEFITSLKNNYPITKVAENISLQGDYQLKAARGNYDPVIDAVHENKFYNGKNYFSVAHAELKQPIFTNQFLVAGWDYGQGNFVDQSMQTPNSGTPFLGLETSVLQGLLFDKRRAEVLKAKGYKEYLNAEKKQIINQLLFEASLHFTDFAFAEKELQLYQYFMRLAIDRYKGLIDLSNAGERPAVDTIEASLLFQGRLLEYQSASIDNQKALNKLMNFYWSDGLKPMALDTAMIIKDSIEIYYDKAKQLVSIELQSDSFANPIIEKYRANQKILKVDKRLKAELIKPKLDVKYNFLSTGTNPYSTDYSINNYKWGAKFSMPLFFRTSVNEFKIAKLRLQNNEFELLNKGNELSLKLQTLKQVISMIARQVMAAEKNVAFSKQLLLAEKLKFENGESSLFLLNTRETKWLESELKLAEYRAKFIKLYFELIYTKGDVNYQL
jgi:outer membrane protein TolC